MLFCTKWVGTTAVILSALSVVSANTARALDLGGVNVDIGGGGIGVSAGDLGGVSVGVSDGGLGVGVGVGGSDGASVGVGVGGGTGAGVDVGVGGDGGVSVGVGVGGGNGVGVDVGVGDIGVGVGVNPDDGISVDVGTGGTGTTNPTSPGEPSTEDPTTDGTASAGVTIPSGREVRRAARVTCTNDGNSDLYDGFIVFDRGGRAVGVTHAAWIASDLKLKKLKFATMESFMRPAKCLTVSAEAATIGTGAIRLPQTGNSLLKAIAGQ
jgi:hypothetical protein